MSDPASQLAVSRPPAFLAVAQATGLDQQYLIATIRAQCFKGQATDEQVDAFISIACEMKVNPLLPGMLYAYPISGGGIVPIMGPDGVYKKLTEHPEVDSWETTVFPEDVTQPATHAVTKIYRKGRERPLVYTALLSEWQVGSNPNWKTRTRHMLGLRSLKQCARQIIHGVPYDEDDRVLMGDPINVTPTGEQPDTGKKPDRPTPPPRAPRGAAAVKENPVTKTTPPEIVVPESEQTPEPAAPKVVTPAPAQTPPPAPESEEEAAPPPAPTVPERAFIKRDETLDVVCEVVSVKTVRNAKNEAVVLAQVKGGFHGEVKHTGGATIKGETEVPNTEWAVGSKLKLKLLGVKLVDKKDAAGNVVSAGRVIARVEAVEVVP